MNTIIKTFLLEVIKTNPRIRRKLSLREHLKLYRFIANMSESQALKLYETIKPPQTNPKIQRVVSTGIAMASLVIPIPGLTLAVNKLSDINSYKCSIECDRRDNIHTAMCYTKCRYLSAQWAVNYIEKEITKCPQTKNPYKCKKKLLTLLKTSQHKLAHREVTYRAKERDFRRKGKI